MDNRLYVGNLAYSTRGKDLNLHFSAFGHVVSAQVFLERDSDRSKGFGFVVMDTDEQALAAIDGLHGKEIDGRTLTVSIARPMVERSDNRHTR